MGADLWCREKPENLAHQPLSLIGLENELGVRRPFENNQLFGVGSLLVLHADPEQPRLAVRARIVAAYDEQFAACKFLRRTIRAVCQQDHAINFTWLGLSQGS